jgi:uroporphyrinogen-III decarboxylase
MTGAQRMERMYQGGRDEVPVALFFSTEYICRHSGVPDYRFLYGPQAHRAAAQAEILRRHDADAFYVWTRGKRHDWRRDYQLVEAGPEVYIHDTLQDRRLPFSEDYYAVDFPEKPPYRSPYVQYGESQELIRGVPTFSKPKLDIRSVEDIDRWLPLEPAAQVAEGGMFEGVRLLAEQVGAERFLEVGCDSSFRFALGVLGLQEGLMFMRERPDVFGRLVERMMQQELEYLKVMASYGARGAWMNDIWVDLISLGDYRTFVLPTLVAFVDESRRLGLKAHYFPSGKVAHLIEIVNEVRPDALHLEEYAGIDVAEVRRRLDPRILLYGNVAALEVLQKGPVAAIEGESRRQIEACLSTGPFVLALGSEVTQNTPPEHVDAMIRAARAYRSRPR